MVLMLLVLLLVPSLARAQCTGQTAPLVPLSEEALPVANTAQALSTGQYQQGGKVAVLAMVQVQGTAIRYRLTGAPTPTSGTVVNPWQVFPICGTDSIRAFRAIAATTATQLYITYYSSRTP